MQRLYVLVVAVHSQCFVVSVCMCVCVCVFVYWASYSHQDLLKVGFDHLDHGGLSRLLWGERSREHKQREICRACIGGASYLPLNGRRLSFVPLFAALLSPHFFFSLISTQILYLPVGQ